MEPLGTVAILYAYPVKSLRADVLARADVGPGGFAGDRGSALFVRSPDHARTGKTYRGKENRLLHTTGAFATAHALAQANGVEIAEDDERDHYFDAEPVSIVFDTWIRELEALAGRRVDPLQFRPNIVARATPGFARAERDLIGLQLQIGTATFTVVSAITRCVTISYDIATGAADPALQRTIVRDRDNKMGVYCRVTRPGAIEPGDRLYETVAGEPE